MPALPSTAQMLSGQFVCGFIGISRGDKSGRLLLPTAAAAQLDLIYLHVRLLAAPRCDCHRNVARNGAKDCDPHHTIALLSRDSQ